MSTGNLEVVARKAEGHRYRTTVQLTLTVFDARLASKVPPYEGHCFPYHGKLEVHVAGTEVTIRTRYEVSGSQKLFHRLVGAELEERFTTLAKRARRGLQTKPQHYTVSKQLDVPQETLHIIGEMLIGHAIDTGVLKG